MAADLKWRQPIRGQRRQPGVQPKAEITETLNESTTTSYDATGAVALAA